MAVLLAAAPLVAVLLTMGVLRWSAASAGAVGCLGALAIALVAFDLGGGGVSRAEATVGALAEALHSTLAILWIIFPALAIYEFQKRTGAFDRIRQTLVGLSDDRSVQAVLVAWFFGLFMEGAAGFGTPVALAAPLLVGIGFPPAKAVALALIGHATGVSFGAVGTPVFAQAELTDLPARQIGVVTALLHAGLGSMLLAFLVRLAGGPVGLRTAAWTALAGACFLVPYLGLAVFAGPELPTLGGAMIGLATYVAILLRQRPTAAASTHESHLMPDLASYLVILALVLVTRLVPMVQTALTDISIGWTLHGTFQGSFQPLYHPGTILLLGFVFGGLVAGRGRLLAPAAAAAALRIIPVALALAAMLAMSRLMVHGGLIATLAEAAAHSGSFWPILAPAVGVLGTFVTGSATSSNILFTEFQLTTAAALALPTLLMVAAQGFGAAVGNVVAPHNIIAGAATVGLKGREGDILAQTVGPCAAYAGFGGLVILVAAFLA